MARCSVRLLARRRCNARSVTPSRAAAARTLPPDSSSVSATARSATCSRRSRSVSPASSCCLHRVHQGRRAACPPHRQRHRAVGRCQVARRDRARGRRAGPLPGARAAAGRAGCRGTPGTAARAPVPGASGGRLRPGRRPARRSCRNSGTTSSGRSRSGGSRTDRRRDAGRRSRPGSGRPRPRPPGCGWWHRSAGTGCAARSREPTRLYVPSCTTRSSSDCNSSGSSPTSSSSSVPPLAAAHAPVRTLTAPVNAPRSCPNSSLPDRVGTMVVQSTTTRCPRPAGDAQGVRDPRGQLLAGAGLARAPGSGRCRSARP